MPIRKGHLRRGWATLEAPESVPKVQVAADQGEQ